MSKLNDKVIVKKASWEFINGMCCRVDSPGIITSLKGMKGHTNVHKYEITLLNGRSKIYTDNKKGTGDYLFKTLKPLTHAYNNNTSPINNNQNE